MTQGESGPRQQAPNAASAIDLRTAEVRIRQAAERSKNERFTSLFHHIHDKRRLRKAFYSLKRKAAPGVDGVRWKDYERDLDQRLDDLHDRLQRGAYRPQPVRRVTIPKAGGGSRALGVTTVEDKIVQKATVEVLNCIYEVDFLGFSHGFRPGRGPHNALDALAVGIERVRVNHVLDADIRGFFDAMDHQWLIRFIEHRIADRRVVRLIKKWLHAGVLEQGEWERAESGTPQGGAISPLLANIYLHYAFDLWAQNWREKTARGEVMVVRYADDIVVGF